MRPKSLYIADYSREELQQLAPSALVVLPLGATEQHGPHLPVGTDFYIVEHLAREAASTVSDEFPTLVAPVLAFGSSDHHLPFGGTLSLTTVTYYGVLCDLLRSLAISGFRRLFLLNGHGGNHELAQLAARDVALTHDLVIGAASYWTLAWDALVAMDAHKSARLPGHAGRFETSVMMALRGQYVGSELPFRADPPDSDPKSAYGAYRLERHSYWRSIEGYSDSPSTAAAELGEKYLSVLIEGVANALREFYSADG